MIDIIAGARPNFMKIWPIIRCLEARREAGSDLPYRLVHTGQHYDAAMSGSFFEQLCIPEPHVNLEAGSGTQAEQTAAIMVRYESLLLERAPSLCLVVGDVTSTLACAITARKQGVPVAHVEAGIRSGDWTMPEEINRVVTDSISNWFFTTTLEAGETLRTCGMSADRIFFVGNTMIDTLLANLDRLQPPALPQEIGLGHREYIVLTLHRPSNVDQRERFVAKLRRIAEAARGHPIVFPVHPRTHRMLDGWTPPRHLHLVPPQSYLEFNYLVRHAKGVVTDSGGITEETTVLGVPCMTLRDTTERPETVSIGTNVLLGSDPEDLEATFETLFRGEWKKGSVPERWDGKAGERILAVLEDLLTDRSRQKRAAASARTVGRFQ